MYESIDASSSIPLDRFSTRFSGEGGGGRGKVLSRGKAGTRSCRRYGRNHRQGGMEIEVL